MFSLHRTIIEDQSHCFLLYSPVSFVVMLTLQAATCVVSFAVVAALHAPVLLWSVAAMPCCPSLLTE